MQDIFTGQKYSHVGSVADNIHVPLIEKGNAMVTHIEGNDVHAMEMKTHEMLVLPMPTQEGMTIEAGKGILYMEAPGRLQDH